MLNIVPSESDGPVHGGHGHGHGHSHGHGHAHNESGEDMAGFRFHSPIHGKYTKGNEPD